VIMGGVKHKMGWQETKTRIRDKIAKDKRELKVCRLQTELMMKYENDQNLALSRPPPTVSILLDSHLPSAKKVAGVEAA
jgi:hypothetical protein